MSTLQDFIKCHVIYKPRGDVPVRHAFEDSNKVLYINPDQIFKIEPFDYLAKNGSHQPGSTIYMDSREAYFIYVWGHPYHWETVNNAKDAKDAI